MTRKQMGLAACAAAASLLRCEGAQLRTQLPRRPFLGGAAAAALGSELRPQPAAALAEATSVAKLLDVSWSATDGFDSVRWPPSPQKMHH